jgi:hypothetical protein
MFESMFGNYSRVTRNLAGAVLAGLGASFALSAVAIGAQPPTKSEAFPDLSSTEFAWIKDSDSFVTAPSGGPGPVTFDPAHPYQPNNDSGLQVTYRVADLTNPILKPWAVAQMKAANDEVLAGKQPFRARTSCVPGGVPGILIYGRNEPVYFAQTPNEVLILNQADSQTRHVYMNVAHRAHPAPSWYGESVGHYEGGDTLVVDTIGQNDKSFIDDYRTPHTSQIHVVERYRLTEGGKALQVIFTVEDPGAFNTPWSAMQTFHRQRLGTFLEAVCPENRGSPFYDSHHPIPQADKPDF